ncbi:uncharacterized protein TRIVIDRAFT_220849 [Trichoderma virens Gv29-8]|uniref:Thioesterase domain-containing protein n=1 Tax=Hypocrea virens (strain Gv29-8 / FGSC 10586) TaxID=413071 RepID=G9MNY8_HYPVG|nr:uncharacterized protein TRIVIDRAFT_220849 [Trichoderma virens Gv29-8]EHK23590.1 hypothetical protein TRIVIDRAFT_220849 [Trichoderma virens Gv29-8]
MRITSGGLRQLNTLVGLDDRSGAEAGRRSESKRKKRLEGCVEDGGKRRQKNAIVNTQTRNKRPSTSHISPVTTCRAAQEMALAGKYSLITMAEMAQVLLPSHLRRTEMVGGSIWSTLCAGHAAADWPALGCVTGTIDRLSVYRSEGRAVFFVIRSTVTTVASGVAVRQDGGVALVMEGAQKRRAPG